MHRVLKIAHGLTLPLDVITEKMAILAMSGAGKTYLAGVIVEQMLSIGAQVVILDIPGAWWGLASSADGKSPGFPIIIMGGKHGHVPLDHKSGRLVAQFIGKNRGTPVCIDLSDFTTSQQTHFISDFAEELWRIQVDDPQPLHLVLEEAHALVPQERELKEQSIMLGRMRRLIKQGRMYGVGATMISQEPQSIDKRCLNLSSILFVLRILGDLERKAIERWFGENARAKSDFEIVGQLQGLSDGEAILCSPKLLGKYEKVSGWTKTTFDSSATPKFGQRKVEPKKAAKVDLDGLRSKMRAMIDQAEADDPKALKKKIAKLEADLRKPAAHAPPAIPAKPTVEHHVVEVQMLKPREKARLSKFLGIAGDIEKRTGALAEHAKWLKDEVEKLRISCLKNQGSPRITGPLLDIRDGGGSRSKVVAPQDARPNGYRSIPVRINRDPSMPSGDSIVPAGELSKGERAVLTAVAQATGGTASAEEVSVLTGYKRSSRDLYLQRLRRFGYVAGGSRDLRATESGISALGNGFEPLPTGDALRAHWLSRLGGGEREILRVATERYPQQITKDELSEVTPYKRSSRDLYLQRLARRKLVEIDRGMVRASNILFGPLNA